MAGILNVVTTQDHKAWLQAEADKRGMSVSALVRFIIREYRKNAESRRAEFDQH
jgi:hypothetical protein